EVLEDRTVLSVTFGLSQSVLGGQVLAITSNNARDVVTIDDDGTSNVGNIKLNGQTINANVSEVLFIGNGGNDSLTYNLNGDLQAARTVTANMGRDNDSFVANLNGNMLATPNGNLFKNGLAINVSGGLGVDSLRVNADS